MSRSARLPTYRNRRRLDVTANLLPRRASRTCTPIEAGKSLGHAQAARQEKMKAKNNRVQPTKECPQVRCH